MGNEWVNIPYLVDVQLLVITLGIIIFRLYFGKLLFLFDTPKASIYSIPPPLDLLLLDDIYIFGECLIGGQQYALKQ